MKNLSSRAQGLIAINIAAVIFGSTGLFGKLHVSVFWIVAMRSLFAAVAIYVLGSQQGESFPLQKLNRIIVITGLFLATHWATFFASVQLAGIAIATLTFASFPLFTILLEYVWRFKRGEKRINFVEFAAGAIIIVAVLISVDLNFTQAPFVLFGTIIGLVSAITFACFGVISKTLGTQFSVKQISFYQNSVVFTSMLPFLLFARPIPASPREWLLLLFLGIVATAMMHQLYFYALKRLSASTCSGFVALEPIYAIVFAALLFHEAITWRVALSAVLIVSASFVLMQKEKENNIAL